jgi:hypothetical protein
MGSFKKSGSSARRPTDCSSAAMRASYSETRSAGLAKVKLRGRDRVDAIFVLALAAYNLIRLPKLLAAPA